MGDVPASPKDILSEKWLALGVKRLERSGALVSARQAIELLHEAAVLAPHPRQTGDRAPTLYLATQGRELLDRAARQAADWLAGRTGAGAP